MDLDRPIVLIVEGDDLDDLTRQALRIGHDEMAGVLDGGFEQWASSGRPVETSGRRSIDELAADLAGGSDSAPFLIDVRQASEYEGGHVPGAWHVNGGSLPDRLAELPRDRPIATICAAGFRASIAASLLRASGFEDVSWVAQGFPAWRAAGYPVEVGAVNGRGPGRDAVSPEPVPTHRH